MSVSTKRFNREHSRSRSRGRRYVDLDVPFYGSAWDRKSAQVLHHHSSPRLSLGVELECAIPDIRQLPRVSELLAGACKADVLSKVAEELTRKVQHMGMREEHDDRRVSSQRCDWGRFWTVTEDTTIQLSGANPFALEAVSKRMCLIDADRALFCDITKALYQPPFSAILNESTGIHVHIGCYPNFFTTTEIACIIKAYLRLEPAINRLLLPPRRANNRFCLDLADVLVRAKNPGESTSFGETHRNMQESIQGGSTRQSLDAHIDNLMASSSRLLKTDVASLQTGARGLARKSSLLMAVQRGPLLLGLPLFWRTRTAMQLRNSQNTSDINVPRGMVLHSVSSCKTVLWNRPTATDLMSAIGARRDNLDLPAALGSVDDAAEVECLFCIPEGVSANSTDLWLLRDGLVFDREEARGCKLNLTRIALPSAEATLEFRQFPACSFDDPLFIWGWVNFLARLVDRACAVAAGIPGSQLPASDSKEDLERFLELSSDPILSAWYEDACKRLPHLDANASCYSVC